MAAKLYCGLIALFSFPITHSYFICNNAPSVTLRICPSSMLTFNASVLLCLSALTMTRKRSMEMTAKVLMERRPNAPPANPYSSQTAKTRIAKTFYGSKISFTVTSKAVDRDDSQNVNGERTKYSMVHYQIHIAHRLQKQELQWHHCGSKIWLH